MCLERLGGSRDTSVPYRTTGGLRLNPTRNYTSPVTAHPTTTTHLPFVPEKPPLQSRLALVDPAEFYFFFSTDGGGALQTNWRDRRLPPIGRRRGAWLGHMILESI